MRDLGLLTSFNDAHQNLNSELADDLMLTRSDPIKVSDICGGEERSGQSSMQLAVGSCSRAGSKSIRWAILWRAVYGARLGRYTQAPQGRRDIERVPKESVIRHVPLVQETKVVFEYDEHFKLGQGILCMVSRRCPGCRQANGRCVTRPFWPLAKEGFRPLARVDIRLCRFVQVGELMCCGLGLGKTDAYSVPRGQRHGR